MKVGEPSFRNIKSEQRTGEKGVTKHCVSMTCLALLWVLRIFFCIQCLNGLHITVTLLDFSFCTALSFLKLGVAKEFKFKIYSNHYPNHYPKSD